MQKEPPDFTESRRLFALGYTARQIAVQVDLLPSIITAAALEHNWPCLARPDWNKIRARYEAGEDIMDIVQHTTISLSTLRKRKRRENWTRSSISGLAALRAAVTALEATLAATCEDDPVLTIRVGTALSMAAGRLSRAENGKHNTAADEAPLETPVDPDDDFSMAELARIMQDWRPKTPSETPS